MDFETLKQSSSNFDKLTKAIEANLNPEDKEKKQIQIPRRQILETRTR